MPRRPSTFINRVKDIYQKNGFLATIKRVLVFIISILYQNEIYHVYGRALKEDNNEANRMPKIQNITHRMVETVQQLDELSDEGFDLSLIDIDLYRHRLQKGATSNLIFVNHELGFAGWGALTEEAMKSLVRYPLKIDFVNNEAFGAEAWTNPKYRRQGFHNYAGYKWDKYCIEKGVTKDRSIILSSNVASQRSTTKMGSKLLAKARYIRIFGIQLWRETPVKSTNSQSNY
ncbi:MAG TPA: hypothetical protein G4O10_04425 [Dehalococcoidia bacterium]|nr:hypothetical protein [Dehalococcoidia bacterium]